MSDSGELKPCPFCGGKPILNEIEPHSHALKFNGVTLMPDYHGSWTIECCDVGMIKDTREEVVTAWNRRAQPERKLTDAEIDDKVFAFGIQSFAYVDDPAGYRALIRAILAAQPAGSEMAQTGWTGKICGADLLACSVDVKLTEWPTDVVRIGDSVAIHKAQPAAATVLRIDEALKSAAKRTRDDLGETGCNYHDVRKLLSFVESAIAAQPAQDDGEKK